MNCGVSTAHDTSGTTLTASLDLPWYVTGLLVSQPLHFGDYGGRPMQILWAMLDVITIFVLGSGLYLWFSRRKARQQRIATAWADVETDGAAIEGATR